MCTVEGLHFNTVYQLRVRAYNASGVSTYSAPVAIRTSTSKLNHFTLKKIMYISKRKDEETHSNRMHSKLYHKVYR